MTGSSNERQVVVLVRGYPGVGKTTVSLALAKHMQYCLICKDDVREAAIRHDSQVLADIRAVCPQHASQIRVDSNDMTYEAMFAVGLTQLRVGASGVVLESPLGRVALGKRALEIVHEARALCVLVDCILERSEWEQRLAKRRGAHQFRPTSAEEFRPTSAEEIVRHYTNIEYKIDCDAHVTIDCGMPPERNVDKIAFVIQQLLADEGNTAKTSS